MKKPPKRLVIKPAWKRRKDGYWEPVSIKLSLKPKPKPKPKPAKRERMEWGIVMPCDSRKQANNLVGTVRSMFPQWKGIEVRRLPMLPATRKET